MVTRGFHKGNLVKIDLEIKTQNNTSNHTARKIHITETAILKYI